MSIDVAVSLDLSLLMQFPVLLRRTILGQIEDPMGRRRHTADHIIAKLQGAEVLLGKGMPIEEVLLQLAR
jgi:hypothetical protein